VKAKFMGVVLFACVSLACATKGAKARFYEDELDIKLLQNSHYKEVTDLFGTWEFGVLDTWEAVNPTEKDIARLDNRRMGAFSEREKRNVFKEPGSYNVIFLSKLEKKESASLGEISGMGLSTRKDNVVDIEKYTLIRVVFRDKRLVQYKIWPNITSSTVSGFKIKRH
jgi:hypothetical protein